MVEKLFSLSQACISPAQLCILKPSIDLTFQPEFIKWSVAHLDSNPG